MLFGRLLSQFFKDEIFCLCLGGMGSNLRVRDEGMDALGNGDQVSSSTQIWDQFDEITLQVYHRVTLTSLYLKECHLKC